MMKRPTAMLRPGHLPNAALVDAARWDVETFAALSAVTPAQWRAAVARAGRRKRPLRCCLFGALTTRCLLKF